MTEKVRPTPIIDVLFPGQRVHLIGGPSGSGKTTWLLQILEQWRKGEPIFGFKSHPASFVYLSYDRGQEDFDETCDRLKIDSLTYNFYAPNSSQFDVPLVTVLANLATKFPDARLFIVEGFAIKCPNGKINDQAVVGKWLRQVQEFCSKNTCTVIGVMHSAKTKERDRYREPRARLAGCAAWAGYASTVIIIEERNSDDESELRDLYVLPRNDRKHKYILDCKDGFMVEAKKEGKKEAKFLQWLGKFPKGSTFTVADAKQGTELSDSRVYAELDLAGRKPTPKIEKTGPGTYTVL